jgi:betaine-aldehyde dehydrogenase
VTGERRYEAVGVAALIVPWNFPMATQAHLFSDRK